MEQENGKTTAVANTVNVTQDQALTHGIFKSVQQFEFAQRVCKALMTASMLPKDYKESLGNMLIALEYASRSNLPTLAVMQNLHIIYGRPSWSSQYVIAAINSSGLFSPLRYEWRGAENTDAWSCRAKARDLESNDVLFGPWISIELSKKEGWYDRKDRDGKLISKWRTMPETMLMYRAASMFGRFYAPHVLMGMTVEEAEDIQPSVRTVEGERVDDAPKQTPPRTSDEDARADLVSRVEQPRKRKSGAGAERPDPTPTPTEPDRDARDISGDWADGSQADDRPEETFI